jgi:tRNA modification GTPase
MITSQQDTIAAVSTPPGDGGIAVIRISGSDALSIANKIFFTNGSCVNIKNHYAIHGWIVDEDEAIDEVVVVYFKHPHSYTGEDVVEISCHGNTYITNKILNQIFNNGARSALPGEFTLRAFLNGKMDLAQAESVADLIHSKTEASRKVAMDQLEGHFSEKIQNFREQLIEVCSFLEIQLDFPEENNGIVTQKEIQGMLIKILNEIESMIKSYERGRICQDGFRIALVGAPNVGKSSILNCLLEKERAIVTEIPGTKRDPMEDVPDINEI